MRAVLASLLFAVSPLTVNATPYDSLYGQATCHINGQADQISDVSCGQDNPSPGADDTARVRARYGDLGGKTLTETAANPAGLYTASSTDARFHDTLTINSPGLAGQVGTVSMSMSLHAVANATASQYGSGTASYELDLESNQPTTQSFRHYAVTAYSDGSRNVVIQGSDNGVAVPFASPISDSFQFVFGQSFVIEARLTTSANGMAGGGNTNVTASWTGIGVSFAGATVPFTVLSASGTDWAHAVAPVPEPSVAVLFLAGLASLGLLRRWRSSHEEAMPGVKARTPIPLRRFTPPLECA